ncbi:MAG TPA: type II toxin-antitoxin system VapC family toxin [Isosphaeraceae bacterium]
MSFLLDTNVCSGIMRKDRRLFSRTNQYTGRLFTSRIVVAELYAWAHAKIDPAPILKRVDLLLHDVGVLEFADDCADQFGRLKGQLRPRGITIPPLDLLIASTSLVHGFTLVTHNTRDFAPIPGLAVVDWLAP